MAFNHVNSRPQVIKTYGRHKKRTIKAWISPQQDTRARQLHVFSSPEDPSLDLDTRTCALTASIHDESSNLHTDDEWFPVSRQHTKKALKEKNIVSKSSRLEKKSVAHIKPATSRNGRRGKENVAEDMSALRPTAKGNRVGKLCQRDKGCHDGASGCPEERDKKKTLPGRPGLMHSPIDRRWQSSSKRGRVDGSVGTLDASRDLFAYSGDESESDPGSCGRAEAEAGQPCSVAANAARPLDESLFASPLVLPSVGQRAGAFLETSTPNHCESHPAEPTKMQPDRPTQRVTRASHRGKPSVADSVADSAGRPDASADFSNEQAPLEEDHRMQCERGKCEVRMERTQDLFDLASDISRLDLNTDSDGITAQRTSSVSSALQRAESAHRDSVIISPCSVVVVPLSPYSLSRHSSSSVLSSPIGQTDEAGNECGSELDVKDELPGTPSSLRVVERTRHSFKEALTPVKSKRTGRLITARQKVLKQCQQTSPILFTEALPPDMLEACVKIGEGVYGEVFRTINSQGDTVALKVIPIDGSLKVNQESQKSFEEILPEIVISRELSGLRHGSSSSTGGFVAVNRVSCCQGSYPAHLMAQWDRYNADRGSENDRPDFFPPDQLFIVFEFADGGMDLERMKLTSLHQALSVFQQVALSLAVAEQSFEFEHRDLHWGNVLVLPTTERSLGFWLDSEEIRVASHGVQAGMIDFTLSRLSKDGCTVYCDLSNDETLFTGRGDPQFGIYRKMRDENDNNWEPWNPHTNVLWLHYLLDKLLNAKAYPGAKRDPAQSSLRRELRTLSRHMLAHSSALELIAEGSLLDL